MGRKFKILILAAAISMGLSACQESQAPQDYIGDDFIEVGQDIVKTRCTFCHTAKPSGDSPRSDAPPLRHVLANYNPDALADDFREGLHVGHPDMPDFDFNVKEVDGLLAYLISIQEPSIEPQ